MKSWQKKSERCPHILRTTANTKTIKLFSINLLKLEYKSMTKKEHLIPASGIKCAKRHMMNRPVGLLLGLGLTFYAGSAFAQNEKVSLNRQNAKTIQVLNDIEKQTNYLFV